MAMAVHHTLRLHGNGPLRLRRNRIDIVDSHKLCGPQSIDNRRLYAVPWYAVPLLEAVGCSSRYASAWVQPAPVRPSPALTTRPAAVFLELRSLVALCLSLLDRIVSARLSARISHRTTAQELASIAPETQPRSAGAPIRRPFQILRRLGVPSHYPRNTIELKIR